MSAPSEPDDQSPHAEAAAKAAGVTIGEWLSQIITELTPAEAVDEPISSAQGTTDGSAPKP